MTTAPMNYQLFKIELDTIPTFEGKETQINAFCMACENIYVRYQNVAEVQTVLRAAIFSKFRGKASEILSPRDDLINWPQIKDAIIQHFSDTRDLEQLTVEFNNIKINRGESLIDFGYRIRSALGKLLSKLNISNIPHTQIRQEILISNALDRYLVTIPYHISMQVRSRQPVTLEQAISYAQDEINFAQRSGQNTTAPFMLNKISQKQNTSNSFTKSMFNQPPSQSHQNPHFQNQFKQPFQNNFRSPLQNQNNPFYNQGHQSNIFRTQQNQFRFPQFNKPSTNVFKPNPNVNLPKPTPMSGVSTSAPKAFFNEIDPDTIIFDHETNQYYAPIDIEQFPENSEQQIEGVDEELENDVTESSVNFTDP